MTSILFVGDSITVGLVGVASGQTDGSSFRRKAASQLQWTAVGPFADPNGLLHGGVGGSTTYTFSLGKAQFVISDPSKPAEDQDHSWILDFKPDVCHVMLGVNDILSFHESPLDLFDRLHNLCAQAVQQMQRYAPNPTVYLSTVCESLMPEQVIRAHALNAKIKSFREISSNYSIVGIDSAGPFNAQIDVSGVKNFTVDGTHPNQRGYDLIAQGLVASVSAASQAQGASTFQKVVGAGLVVGGLYAAKRWLFR